MKRVIITGATGMIGRTLIEYLLKKDIEILAIIRKESKRKDVLPQDDNLEVVECNLDELCNLNPKGVYDTFFHLAWDGTFGDSRNDLYSQNLNVKYSLDAVNLANRLQCKTFIGAGSQAEYGRVDDIIFPTTSVNPENGYGIAKLCAGQMTRLLAKSLNIRHIWTRIFSVYGPYDGEKTMVMNSIKTMIHEGISLEYTKGEQLWDYIYSEDVARAFYLIGEKGIDGSIYCIANGSSRKLYTYIEDIKNSINLGIKLNLGSIPYSENQVMNLCVNITDLTKDTGFIPEIDFKEGIKRTIKWYKESCDKYEKN